MTLPMAPLQYQLRDQDAIRKILAEGFGDIAARLTALESLPIVVEPPPGTTSALRMGFANGQDIIGLGPGVGGWTQGAPIFGLSGYDFSISPSMTSDLIDLADLNDVQLVWGPSGGRFGYIDANGFSRTLYESKVRRFASDPKYADAVKRQRIILMLGDEFNHPAFEVNGVGTAGPDDVNWAGNLHKSIWPNAITTVRMAAGTLHDGWDGSGQLGANFWTGLDYGWSQRSGQHNAETLTDYYNRERSELDASGLGMVPGFNWLNGGLKQNAEGVNACWDVNNDGGSLSGYIIGSVSTPGGARVACGSIDTGFTSQPRVVASPDYIKHWADIVVQDAAAPLTTIWANPVSGPVGGDEAWATELIFRADFVAALDYAINKLNSRPSFTGWRTPKKGVPV